MLSSGCDAHECRVLLPEGVQIGERATCPSLGSPDGVAPDSEACHVSSGDGVSTYGKQNFSSIHEKRYNMLQLSFYRCS